MELRGGMRKGGMEGGRKGKGEWTTTPLKVRGQVKPHERCTDVFLQHLVIIYKTLTFTKYLKVPLAMSFDCPGLASGRMRLVCCRGFTMPG